MVMRTIFGTLLSAILAVTSVTLVLAQNSPSAGTTTLVLCTDQGDHTITLDAKGRQVPMSHPCPDCVAAIAAQDVPHAIALPMPPLAANTMMAHPAATLAFGHISQPARARGPPLTV